MIRNKLMLKYKNVKGKKLYVRFPAKLPEDEALLQEQVKLLAPLTTHVHKPRQKHARFCFVDFATEADRDTCLQYMQKCIKERKDIKYAGIVVSIPQTESHEYLEKLIEKKLKIWQNKKLKNRLKRAAIVSKREEKFTATLIILNLPRRTSTLELRTAFPTAVDVQINRKAAVTLRTPSEACKVYRHPPSIAGTLLKLRFDNGNRLQKKKKNTPKNDIKIEKTDTEHHKTEIKQCI